MDKCENGGCRTLSVMDIDTSISDIKGKAYYYEMVVCNPIMLKCMDIN